MMLELGARELRWIALGCAATLGALAFGAILFAASGVYNIAASRGHWKITELLLEFGMRRSVAMHSLGIAAPPLDDPDLIRLGAAHYDGGCAFCHGAPGEPRTPIVLQMVPPPPDLAHAVPTWSAAELFWIVRNGLKYTGMPGWAGERRDDEVWAVVAFLRRYPNMRPQDYRALARGNAAPDRLGTGAPARSGRELISTCVPCHGGEMAAPASRLSPMLAGQSADYLAMALRQYAEGTRSSGIMQPAAAKLTADDVIELARLYARLPAHRGDVADNPADAIARGRKIATEGIRSTGVPPCLACHGGRSAATFPTLAGQHARYIVGQLRLWRSGLRDRSAHGAIMAPIARRLTEQQSADVAAYLESIAPDASRALSRDTSGTADESVR
jgi:cytochrome c553